MAKVTDVHAGQPVLTAGKSLEQAKVAMILAHGRGSSPRDILTLAGELRRPEVAYLAPQAVGNSWWPARFMEPIATNEPWFSSALATVTRLLERVTAAGIPVEHTILLGFSQGACLALEFAARNARRYGGVAGLSGGLFGPDGTPRDYPGSLAGTPVFLGCSDVDFHIPKERVLESAEVLAALGAQVETTLYPNMDHIINEDELARVQELIAGIL